MADQTVPPIKRPPRNPAGNNGSGPPHEPTDRLRGQVEGMTGVGTPQEDIAAIIGIDEKTLRKHYADELARGGVVQKNNLRTRIWQEAMGIDPKNPAAGITRDANTTLLIFLAKVRLGWKEPAQVHKHVGSTYGDDATPEEVEREVEDIVRRRRAAVAARREEDAMPEPSGGLLH
jgi:hypothetical protein